MEVFISQKIEPINISVQVPVDRDAAFHLFSYRLGDWWPQEYTWSQYKLKSIGMEPYSGGRCTEIGPQGFQLDWGRVLLWQPAERLQLSWHISANRVPQPDPDNSSIIDVTFTSLGAANTSVQLVHSDIENHGEGAAGYRDALASEYGWPFMLKGYVRLAS